LPVAFVPGVLVIMNIAYGLSAYPAGIFFSAPFEPSRIASAALVGESNECVADPVFGIGR
jgi:hypothetical protein